jgi:uncharacterized protein (TIRG00374 family)
MTTPINSSTQKRILLFAGSGLVIFLVYLYYFVGVVNLAQVIGETNLFYYALAFLAFLVSVFFSSLTWHSLLNNLTIHNEIRRAFLFTWAGLFFDSVVPDPGWTGDLSKAYLMSKTLNEDTGRTAASVISQKILGLTINTVALISALSLLALNYALPMGILPFIVVVLVLTVFTLAMLYYLSVKPSVTKRILGGLIRLFSSIRGNRWNSHEFRVRAEEMLGKFHEGIRTLTANPRRLVRPIVFSALSWGFDVSVIFLTFVSLSYPIPFDKVLIVYVLTGTLQAMGVSFVGFTEVVVSSSYAALGIPLAISLTVTLLARIVVLWFKLIVSYFAFQWAGIGLLLGRKPTDQKSQPNDFAESERDGLEAPKATPSNLQFKQEKTLGSSPVHVGTNVLMLTYCVDSQRDINVQDSDGY